MKIRSAVFSSMLATLGLALTLSPRPADAFGGLQHVNFGGGGHSGFGGGGHSGFGGGGHSSGGHASGPVGGWSGHSSFGWSGHSWQGRPGGWDGFHHHHFRDGVFFDFGFWGPYWDPWWGWGYPYYYAPSYPVYVAPDVTPAPSAPPPPSYWYYCPSAKAYYPYVSQCAVPWVPVSPTPPG